jgi:biopolymer transport protein ExbD
MLQIPGNPDADRVKLRVDDEMDMTPMVDVTFLLLIFFMVTAAFALQKALQVPASTEEEAAQAQSADQFEEDQITLRVDGDNVFWIGAPGWGEERQAPSVQQMLVYLREAREAIARIDTASLLVQANGDAVHESVVAALDGGMSVGLEDIRLQTYEDEEM